MNQGLTSQHAVKDMRPTTKATTSQDKMKHTKPVTKAMNSEDDLKDTRLVKSKANSFRSEVKVAIGGPIDWQQKDKSTTGSKGLQQRKINFIPKTHTSVEVVAANAKANTFTLEKDAGQCSQPISMPKTRMYILLLEIG